MHLESPRRHEIPASHSLQCVCTAVTLPGVSENVNTHPDCRALIVEDDPGSREPLATFLRRRGYNVETASTVAAGRAKLTADVTHLILDLRLPDGTGLRLL